MKGARLIFFSSTLGFVTAFFVRDEQDFPTYMRIKKAYLDHNERLLSKPEKEVLMIIDPMQYYREFGSVQGKVIQSYKQKE